MIYWLYEIRGSLFPEESIFFKLFNLFSYHTFRAGTAGILAFLLSLAFGPRVIRKLISLKVGQPIRTAEEVHRLYELHGAKKGTPTMGGTLILSTLLISVLVCAKWNNPFIYAILFVVMAHGLLGFADDYLKVKKKNSKGVNARVKIISQCSIAIVGCALLYFNESTASYIRQLYIPFVKDALIPDMGIATFAFFALVIIGSSNAVNLTDGLDGLATGCMITTTAAYGVFSYIAGSTIYAAHLFLPSHPAAAEVTVFCVALIGSCFGFLWFNCHPARVFMGDTGSLALGAAIGMIAICCKQEITLIIVGGIFVMEALSVIIQVGSFKLRKKRVFRMAPIHHHFELGGWKENQVIIRFWILSAMFALIGLSVLKLR